MAGFLDILDALLPSQVAAWFSSFLSYKNAFKSAEILSYDDLISLLSASEDIKSELINLVLSEKPVSLLVITVPDANKFVKGQIIGLNDKFKSVFIISDESLNHIGLPYSNNGNYKISLNHSS